MFLISTVIFPNIGIYFIINNLIFINMDFDWTDDIKIGLKVGEKYVITSENGLFKYTMIYCGRGTTTHPDTNEEIDGHRFKDPNREKWDKKCNSWWSDSNLIAHMRRGHIVPYEEHMNENFDWAEEISPTPYNGVQFVSTTKRENIVYTITDNGGPHVVISWNNGDSYGTFGRGEVEEHFRKGNWAVVNNDLKEDFDWVNTISDDPIRWKKPKVTLDNVERDADDWPVHYGDGEGEVWIDFEKYTNQERIEIFHNIEKHLGTELVIDSGSARESRDVKIIMCTANDKKGLLLHCGHEENHFFSQENHVCCMPETYQEFKEYEEENPYALDMPFRDRPIVDGGIFLDKTSTINEGFYYKGVNPTVDLIVIRGDKVLLIKRGDDVEAEPGKWALPGGFHDTNAKKGEEWRNDKESALEAAKREVKEETGLDVDRIDGLNFQLVGVFEGGGRDPRDKEDSWTRSTVYMVHIPESEGDDVRGMDDAQRAEWVPLSLVLQRKLAFDHHKIIEKGLQMNESDAFNNLDKLLTEDFDWVDDVGITEEAIRDLMSNCEDVPVTNFNLDVNSPYTKRGKMNIMYYSMCPYWWDKLKDEPVDEHGRGKGEWFRDEDYGRNSVAIIMPDRNGVTDIRDMDLDDYSAITYDLDRVAPYFNGERNELWLFLDENGDPRYDLLPDHLVDRVRKGFEGVEKATTLEENFDWVEDVEDEVDVELWESIANTIDDEVSTPYWDN
jgi:ADP-ribose pyrophosphatase YjhB (NUDIX family)